MRNPGSGWKQVLPQLRGGPGRARPAGGNPGRGDRGRGCTARARQCCQPPYSRFVASQPAGAQPAAPAHAPRPRHSKVPLFIGAAAVVVVAAAGLLVWDLFFAPYDISDKTFSDVAVRNAVMADCDADHDGKLSRDEAKAVTTLTVDGAGSVSGLGRYLPNLASLTLTGATLNSVDTSDLPNLEGLDVRDTSVATLDVSKNPKLASLAAGDAVQVSGLDQTSLVETWLPGEIDLGGRKYLTTYNADGTIAKLDIQSETNGSWQSAASRAYTYENGRPVSIGRTATDHGSTYSYKTSLSYDDRGRLSSASTDTGSTTYSYDAAGNLSKVETKYGSSTSGSLTTYQYDDKGRCVKVSEDYGSSVDTTTYAYDDQGRCVSKTVPDGSKTSTITYAYDADGHVVAVTSDGSYGWDLSYGYENGLLATVTAKGKDGAADESWKLSYDDAGRLVSAEQEGKSGTSYSIAYTRLFTSKDAAAPVPGFSVAPSYQTISPIRLNVVGVNTANPGVPAPEPFDASGFVTRLDMWS